VLLDAGAVVADGTLAEWLASTPLYAEVLAQAEELDAARLSIDEAEVN
jgi:ATP-binding cassette subfamily B protein